MPGPTSHFSKREVLEKHFQMQDLEFTIKTTGGISCKPGKASDRLVAIKIAVDMVKEKLISKGEALPRIPADSLSHVLAPIFDRKRQNGKRPDRNPPARRTRAASGRLVLRAEDGRRARPRGGRVLPVRLETSPEDLRGMIAAEGIPTARGGVSSHAALVARQMEK